MHNIYLEPLISQIEEACENNDRLLPVYKKIKGKIYKYAESLNIPIKSLLVTHVVNNNGKIDKGFIAFLENRWTKKKNLLKEKKYHGEIYSNLRRLISSIVPKDNTTENVSKENLSHTLILERQSPKWLDPLLKVLPRHIIGRGKNTPKGEKYRLSPLTDNSILLLNTILKVINLNGLKSLESLFIDSHEKILTELKNYCFGNKFSNIRSSLYKRRKQLGFSFDIPKLKSLPVENWSPKFNSQWETFEKSAGNKNSLNNSRIAKAAIKHKISLNSVKEITFDSYKKALCIGLFYCQPLPENWGIEDLLKVETRVFETGEVKYEETYNQFVEKFQLREQNCVRRVKRSGYNSSTFTLFKTALKSVGVHNGFFSLVERFGKAHTGKLDLEMRNSEKEKKKKVYSIKEIDELIESLEYRFLQVVKDQSFKRQPGISSTITDENMRLCLFYPMFLVLRLLGIRQKNVRNFRLMLDPENPLNPDGNIGFRKDGTLVIHFQDYETKNGKTVHHEYNLNQHELTHGRLIHAMKIYLKKVYPYIILNASLPLDRQVFVVVSRKMKGFIPLPDNARSFNSIFKSWANEFVTCKNLTKENYIPINPHFLRGLCTDWLVTVLKFTIDQAAEYIADDPLVLRKHYLDRNRIFNATDFVTEKNKLLRESSLTNLESEKESILIKLMEDLQKKLIQQNEVQLMLESKIEAKESQIQQLISHLDQKSQDSAKNFDSSG